MDKKCEQDKEELKGSIRYFDGGDGRVWTLEEKAKARSKFPKKLNGFGKWFFSNDEPLIVVNNPDAVYGRS